MPNITIHFSLNKKVDQKVAFLFHNQSKAGSDFSKRITEILPRLDLNKLSSIKMKKKRIAQAVDNYYFLHKSELLQSKEKIEQIWRKNEHRAIEFYNNFFNLNPNFSIKAYLSIFNINPRDIEDKIFQVWHRKKNHLLHLLSKRDLL